MNQDKLICYDCKRSRRTSNGNIVCTTIGDPVLVWRYGNRCRRYQPKTPTTATQPTNINPIKSLFDE